MPITHKQSWLLQIFILFKTKQAVTLNCLFFSVTSVTPLDEKTTHEIGYYTKRESHLYANLTQPAGLSMRILSYCKRKNPSEGDIIQ